MIRNRVLAGHKDPALAAAALPTAPRAGLLNIALLTGLILFAFTASLAAGSPGESLALLPDRIGDFYAKGKAQSPARPVEGLASDFNIVSSGERTYRSSGGKQFSVLVATTSSDSGSYSLLTNLHQVGSRLIKEVSWEDIQQCSVGTACISTDKAIAFCKGKSIVSVVTLDADQNTSADVLALAQLVSSPIDPGEKDVPVLVKHLPDWQSTEKRAVYVVSLDNLKMVTGQAPILNVLNFEGSAEAVTATYDSSRLVIIEYTTPQIAADNDSRIKRGIEELRSKGELTPSGYRRVGNYSVLVFDAPDAAAANRLIDQVHYEQLVQWLGPSPRALERAQRRYAETTANVIVSVLKASGLSLLLCLGVGGVFGAMVFRRRRAQQNTSTAYSDAGGMIRLNIDDLSHSSGSQTPSKLLERGN